MAVFNELIINYLNKIENSFYLNEIRNIITNGIGYYLESREPTWVYGFNKDIVGKLH